MGLCHFGARPLSGFGCGGSKNRKAAEIRADGERTEKERVNKEREEKGSGEKSIEIRERAAERRKRNWRCGQILIITAAVVILILVSWEYFTFLETQMFEERKNHIVEFTEKAAEIVDSEIESAWQQMSGCEHIIRGRVIGSKEELVGILASASDFINESNTIVLAIDENANYWASDQAVGRWPQTELLTEKAEDRQQIVGEIPHKPGDTWFTFVKRLAEPIRTGSDSGAVTHLAIAVDIVAMREKISVKGFGDRCYTYLVNEDGRRLYKYTYSENFIEGYNVLNAFRDYKILNGGTYNEFIHTLERGESTAIEFAFEEPGRKRQDWFVANAAISSENWQILLFVPTGVLGANSSMLMNRTIRFFAIACAVFVAMISIIVGFVVLSRSDKRLMQQKDEANRMLMLSADEARSANQAKSDFLSHMSHDIRTPINGIMGMTEIAIKNVGNQAKVLDCLQKISGSSQHLLGLVNDVLDMSRIESGKTKVNHESFDLRTCIDNCISIIGGQMATREVELIKEVGAMEHPLLIGDELHLRQVFINILGNSVKFTPDGGKIFFRAEEKESTADRAFFRFELEDTGMGMKPEFLPRLFEAFAQEDDGMRTTYKGTGLGMAITKKFLDMMGAEVEVTSQVNVGTKFVVELWMDIDREEKPRELDAGARIHLNDVKILLVEDIELNLEIAQSILEEEGAVVTPAMNGKEAVDAFSDNPAGTFDVILMDIMMPVMDGLTATRTIRALPRPDAGTIPIIAMTANAYAEDVRNTQEAGMNAHLSKPIDVERLLKTVSHYYRLQKNQIRAFDLAGRKILLADDVELNREIAQELLSEAGAHVTMTCGGQEVLDAFRNSPAGTFDVILMDVHMPGLDGLEATRAIRALQREDAGQIPILAMTADVYEEDMQKTKEAGMNGHLTKPLDVKKIAGLLSELQEFS